MLQHKKLELHYEGKNTRDESAVRKKECGSLARAARHESKLSTLERFGMGGCVMTGWRNCYSNSGHISWKAFKSKFGEAHRLYNVDLSRAPETPHGYKQALSVKRMRAQAVARIKAALKFSIGRVRGHGRLQLLDADTWSREGSTLFEWNFMFPANFQSEHNS